MALAGKLGLAAIEGRSTTFDPHIEGDNFLAEGNLIDGDGASAAFADIYRRMHATLCPDPGVPASPWPGAEAMRAELAATVEGQGGPTPTCTLFADGFESGDTGAWSATARLR